MENRKQLRQTVVFNQLLVLLMTKIVILCWRCALKLSQGNGYITDIHVFRKNLIQGRGGQCQSLPVCYRLVTLYWCSANQQQNGVISFQPIHLVYVVVGVLQINSTESQGEIPSVTYVMGSNIVSITGFDAAGKLIEYPHGEIFKISFPFKVNRQTIIFFRFGNS